MPDWEAVLWDIGGVILDHESVQRGQERFIRALAAEHGLDAERALSTWRRELGEYFRERDGQTYRPARVGYHRAVESVVGAPVPCEGWFPLMYELTHETFEPVAGAPETVRALDEAGLHLGIVSDIDAWEAEHILGLFGVRERFEDVTTSEEVGHTKPHAAIFEAALEKAGVAPERALYVGDRYEHDMRGGARAGLGTVAYGGSAAGSAPDPGDDHRVDDPAVDYVIDDLGDLLDVVGVE